MSLATGIAKCRFCDKVYQVPAPSPGVAAGTRSRISKNFGEPPKFVTESSDIDGTKLAYKAGMAGGCGLLFFAAFWDGFLIFWYTIAFSANAPAIMFVFPLIHVAVGIGVTYAALSQILNKTTITLSGDKVKIATSPIPTGKSKEIFSGEFKQLFVSSNSNTKGAKGVKSYELHMMRRDGRAEAILKNIHDLDSALFLERRIENYYAIADEVVEGEVGTVE